MKLKIRKYWEVLLIRIAAWLITSRNVQRSMVVSRRDNNEMEYMSEKLESICARMLDEYNKINY